MTQRISTSLAAGSVLFSFLQKKIIEHSRQQLTSHTPTPMASSKPKSPEPTPPDEPLFTKPKIKPTGKIR